MFDKDTVIYILAVLTVLFLIGLALVASHKSFEDKERYHEAVLEEQKAARQTALENSKKLDMLLDIATNRVTDTERK